MSSLSDKTSSDELPKIKYMAEGLSHGTTEQGKLLYIIIHDEGKDDFKDQRINRSRSLPPPRYTRSVLQSTLQLMGCKARHAFKISDRVFDVLRCEIPCRPGKIRRYLSEAGAILNEFVSEESENTYADGTTFDDKEVDNISQGYKKRATIEVRRDKFLDVVCDALSQYQYVGPKQRDDLLLACRMREKKTSVTILLCGTSGCGKSTLSSLLASRLGITTVVSTDSVRHMMRSFVSKDENPLLWASTYHAGDCLDPMAIAEAKTKKKVAKMASIPVQSSSFDQRSSRSNSLSGVSSAAKDSMDKNDGEESGTLSSNLSHEKMVNEISSNGDGNSLAEDAVDTTKVGSKTIVVQGYKAQSEMVIDSLDRLITMWELKNESVIVEGVHLSLNFVMGLMKKHPSIVPFMIYISNEGKHLERFAVRAKYMTLDPAKNKYVKYIKNIRTIQEYLCKRADKHLVPKVSNTNVDKSIAIIHATIFSCLRRRVGGDPLYDPGTITVKVVDQEYRSQYAASSLGSKGMFQLIQRRGSSRHLMALMNIDGSVAKAWPIDANKNGKPAPGSSNGPSSGLGIPVYGPLAIAKSESVNLQFGKLGLSAWLTDTGAPSNGASIGSSVDGQSSRGEGDLNSCVPGSSCSSSPKHGESCEKELTVEVAVSGSDEEPDDEEPREVDSDGEASDFNKEGIHDDEDGSVDDQSERSDEDDDFEGLEHGDVLWSADPLEEDSRQRDGNEVGLPVRPGQKSQPQKFSHPYRSQRRPLSRNLHGLPSQFADKHLHKSTDSHSHNRSKSFPS